MKTIALIYPRISFERDYPTNWIPFSILSLGGSFKGSNFRIRLFDEHVTPAEEILKELANDSLFVIGLSIMTGGGQIANALHLAKLLKQEHPQAITVFGGPHANVLPEQTVEHELVDYVLCGSGQTAFRSLVEKLDQRQSLDDFPGLYFHKNGKTRTPAQKRAVIKELTEYDFDLLDIAQYIKPDKIIADRTLNYISSQGCPYGCGFCYENIYGRKYHTLGSGLVERDLAIYAKNYNVHGIKFYDADFFINFERSSSIIQSLKAYGLAWAASIHPRDILCQQHGARNRLLEELAGSSCKRLLMGMESGNDRILQEVIKKKASTKDYLQIARIIGDYEIVGSYAFMIGFPGETRREYEDTCELIERLRDLKIPLETKLHLYLPYPGTPLFQAAVEAGFAPPNGLEGWSQYNYYKAMTPWIDKSLEQLVHRYTHLKNM